MRPGNGAMQQECNHNRSAHTRSGMLLMLRGSFSWQAHALRSRATDKRVPLPHCLRPINQTNATSGTQNTSVMHVGIPVVPVCLYGPLGGKGFRGVHRGAHFFLTPVWLRANVVYEQSKKTGGAATGEFGLWHWVQNPLPTLHYSDSVLFFKGPFESQKNIHRAIKILMTVSFRFTLHMLRKHIWECLKYEMCCQGGKL